MTITFLSGDEERASPPLALILHTRALKVESIDAESKERQKVCVKEEGQKIMWTDYGILGFQADEFGFFPAEVREQLKDYWQEM